MICEPRNCCVVGDLINCRDDVGDHVNRCDVEPVNSCEVFGDLMNCSDGVGDLINCCDCVCELMNCCDGVGNLMK